MTLEIAPPHTFCDTSALRRPTTLPTSSFDMRPTPLPAGSFPPQYSSHQPVFRPTTRGPPMGYCYEPTVHGYTTSPTYPPVVVYYHSPPYIHTSQPLPPPRPLSTYGSPYRRQPLPPRQRQPYPLYHPYPYGSPRNDSGSAVCREDYNSTYHSSDYHPTVSPLLSRDDVRKRERFVEDDESSFPLSPIKKQRLFPPLNTPSTPRHTNEEAPAERPTLIDEQEDEPSPRLEETLLHAAPEEPVDTSEVATPMPRINTECRVEEKTTAATSKSSELPHWSALQELDNTSSLLQPPRRRPNDAGVSVADFRQRFEAHCEHHAAALVLRSLRLGATP